MTLLAVYFLPLDQSLEVRLYCIETADLVTTITDADAGDISLLDAARAWAQRNSHTIHEIDNQILRS